MARRLEIGDGLQLPLDWMTMSSVVYGTRGSGKSTLGRKLAEEVFNQGQRFCAIDPTGAWWGLKASASGTDVGLPVVIFGGDHADVPLEPGAGALIADTVAEIGQSTILDLELLSKGKQITFLGAFLERLYHANRDPLLLLMDEAQRYAPQKPMSPDASKTLGAAEDIVKLGRKHGIGPVVFTQRGSGLNKEVSELADVLIAFRTPGVLDQGRIKDWLDANATAEQAREVLSQIAGLPTGTAIFASAHPGLKLFGRIAVGLPRSFDSSATPQVGQKRREPRILAKADLDALRMRMADAIERAKADDPKALRARITELEREVKLLQARPSETVERIVEVQKPYLDPRLREEIDATVRFVREQLGHLADHELPRISSAMLRADLKNPPPVNAGKDDVAVAQPVERRLEVPKVAGSTPARDTTVRTRAVTPLPDLGIVTVVEGSDVKLGKAERLILATLQTHGPRTRVQLAFQTGYSPQTSTLGVALGKLRSLGLVTTGNPIDLTDAGRQVSVDGVETLPGPGPDLAAYWLAKLGKAEREILRTMIEVHPDTLDRISLAERTGYSAQTSTLGVALGKLRRLELLNGWEVSPDLIG